MEAALNPTAAGPEAARARPAHRSPAPHHHRRALGRRAPVTDSPSTTEFRKRWPEGEATYESAQHAGLPGPTPQTAHALRWLLTRDEQRAIRTYGLIEAFVQAATTEAELKAL